MTRNAEQHATIDDAIEAIERGAASRMDARPWDRVSFLPERAFDVGPPVVVAANRIASRVLVSDRIARSGGARLRPLCVYQRHLLIGVEPDAQGVAVDWAGWVGEGGVRDEEA